MKQVLVVGHFLFQICIQEAQLCFASVFTFFSSSQSRKHVCACWGIFILMFSSKMCYINTWTNNCLSPGFLLRLMRLVLLLLLRLLANFCHLGETELRKISHIKHQGIHKLPPHPLNLHIFQSYRTILKTFIDTATRTTVTVTHDIS